jgi:hypothetical protein
VRRVAALALAVAGCTAGPSVAPATVAPLSAGTSNARAAQPNLAAHAIVGFSVDTPKRAEAAAREGITTTILYGGAPSKNSALESALRAHSIQVVDGAISGLLFYWECHRTHTVKPPPGSYSYNYYCRTDENPKIDSEAVVLHDAAALLDADARRNYVTGYWVLDDWPGWDPGSGRVLLQKLHALIAKRTPERPAICGFGAGIALPGRVDWDPGTAANYSNAGCDVVGWYNYSPFGRRRPSLGKRLDWSMKALLPAMQHSLAKYGWKIARTPLYGIGQAWGGSYERRYYQPGLTRSEMRAQADAFCAFGATYIGWYAWDDSGFERRTQTPNNSKTIAAGIAAGIGACRDRWR